MSDDGVPSNTRSRRLVILTVVTCTLVIAGVVSGFIWKLVAPRPELVVYEGGVGYVAIQDSGVGMDLTFGIVAAIAGVVVTIPLILVFKDSSWFLLVTVLIGGVVASVIAWKVGAFLVGGPAEYGPELAQGRAVGDTFQGPLVLSAYGVLFLWSLTSAVVFAFAFGHRARLARKEYEAKLATVNPA